MLGISMGTQRIWVEMQEKQVISVAIQEIRKIRMEMQEVRLEIQGINMETYSSRNWHRKNSSGNEKIKQWRAFKMMKNDRICKNLL